MDLQTPATQGGPPKVVVPSSKDLPIDQPTGPPSVDQMDIPLTPEETAAITQSHGAAVPQAHKSWTDFFEDAAPLIGGTVGGLVGGPVGAAAGAATGSSVGTISHTLRKGLEGPPPDVLGSVAPANLTPAQAGTREAIHTGTKIASDVVTAGILPEVVGAGVNKVIQSPGLMTPRTQLDRDVAAANQDHNLRLGAQNIVPETVPGVIGETVSRASEGSFVGGAIAKRARQQMVAAARKAAAEGKDAFDTIKATLGNIVKTGPTYDMLPHQVEAAHVFADDVAPKLLDLYANRLPQNVQQQLTQLQNGALSPALTRRLIAKVRGALTGAGGPVPTPLLDTLDQILASKETIDFASASDLRSSLRQLGASKDAFLPEAASRLNKYFTGDLTSKMDQYTPWQEYRTLYRQGARGIASAPSKNGPASELGKTLAKSAPETQAEALAAAQGTTGGREAAVVGRLSAINEALKRAGSRPSDWARFHQIVEMGTLGAAAATGHVTGGAAAVAGYESLAGLIAWASHSPSVTKLLTEGLTNKSVQEGAATVTRLMAAYNAARGVDRGKGAGPSPQGKVLGVLQEAAPARAQGPGPGANPGGGGPPRMP